MNRQMQYLSVTIQIQTAAWENHLEKEIVQISE